MNKKHDRQAIFDWIVNYKRSHDGNSPNIREICDGCGISSKSVAFYVLQDLDRMGKIKLTGYYKERQIMVVGGKWSYG